MTTETHLRNIIKSTYGIEHIKTDFDIVDEKGRKVGYTVQVNQIESAILDADARNGWHVEVNLPLTYFEVCPKPPATANAMAPAKDGSRSRQSRKLAHSHRSKPNLHAKATRGSTKQRWRRKLPPLTEK